MHTASLKSFDRKKRENSIYWFFYYFERYMHWISHYQLFLFDLDGLLVNTEELHFHAYIKMCHDRGFSLPWTFPTYFQIAQSDSEALRKQIYQQFPELYEQEPRWEVLYAEKKKAYLDILRSKSSILLPGAETLLLELERRNIKRAVVTHSGRELVEEIKSQNPVLHTIHHWFTREDYRLPKPNPDGYIKAIATLADATDRVIGFEDSFRGMKALMATQATPIYVNATDEETYELFLKQGTRVFRTLEEVCQIQEALLL